MTAEDRILAVLILVVVDDGLVQQVIQIAKERTDVLILVVVDNGLVLAGNFATVFAGKTS